MTTPQSHRGQAGERLKAPTDDGKRRVQPGRGQHDINRMQRHRYCSEAIVGLTASSSARVPHDPQAASSKPKRPQVGQMKSSMLQPFASLFDADWAAASAP
jgi:hypothetical protein